MCGRDQGLREDVGHRLCCSLRCCAPDAAGVCYSRRNWSLLKKPQEFGPFWNLDRWEVSLQDLLWLSWLASQLVENAKENLASHESSNNIGRSGGRTLKKGDENQREADQKAIKDRY